MNTSDKSTFQVHPETKGLESFLLLQTSWPEPYPLYWSILSIFLQGDEVMVCRMRLLTANRWPVEAAPNLAKRGRGFYRAVWSVSSNKRNTENNNQKSKKSKCSHNPREKTDICYKANNMTRNLFIVYLSIHQASISSSLSSELFYTIPEGLNPIDLSQRVTAKCFLCPDCTSFLQFPWWPRIHLPTSHLFRRWVAGSEAHWAVSLELPGLAHRSQQSSPVCLSQGPQRNRDSMRK